MKKLALGLAVLTVMVSCGAKESQPEPTAYEKKLAALEAKIAQWQEYKKAENITAYRIGYDRFRSGFFVNIDMVDGKPLCRRKVTSRGEEFIEKGAEVNTNDWQGTYAYTIEQIHEECREVIKENPEARFNLSWGRDLIWCEGNFGISNLYKGVTLFVPERRDCKDGN